DKARRRPVERRPSDRTLGIKRKIIWRIVFFEIGYLGDLHCPARRALDIVKFVAKPEHHLAGTMRLVALAVRAYAAFHQRTSKPLSPVRILLSAPAPR